MALTTLTAGRNETKTVDTNVHVVFGATNWDAAETKGFTQQRTIELHVISGGNIYWKKLDYDTTLTGAVSSTDTSKTLAAGDFLSTVLAPNQSLFITSASSSSVNASETIHVV